MISKVKIAGFKVLTAVVMNIQVFPYITAVDWEIIVEGTKEHIVIRLSAFKKFGHFLWRRLNIPEEVYLLSSTHTHTHTVAYRGGVWGV